MKPGHSFKNRSGDEWYTQKETVLKFKKDFNLTGRERFGGCMNLKSKRDIEIEKAEQLGLFNDE